MENRNVNTPLLYECFCQGCPAAFTSRYPGSPFCAKCLIDRVVFAPGAAATERGSLPAVLTAAPATPAVAYRASVQYHAVQTMTADYLDSLELARRRRGNTAAGLCVAVAGVFLLLLLGFAASAIRGY